MIVPTGRVLRGLVRLCCRYPVSTVALALALAILAIPVTLWNLRFEASALHLLPPGQAYVSRYREYSRDFGELDEIIIVVRGRTPEESKAYAARLVRELQAGPVAFNHLAYRVTLPDLEGRALLYLPKAALEELRDRIFDYQDFIESFAATPGLVTLLEAVNRQLAVAFARHFFDLGLQDGAAGSDLDFLGILLTQIREAIARPAPYRSPWDGLLRSVEDDPDTSYFFSDDKSLLFILADPVGGSGGFTNDRAAIEDLRHRIAGLRAQFPGVHAGVTGGPALSNDEMRAAFDDSKLATALAFALTLGLLLVAFRRVAQPLAMLAVLALSLLWSLGLITLTVGHLTVFSVMFISIVIGLGIDYGIYVLFRQNDEVALGRDVAAALDITATRTGPGVLLGALTAAATFYVLLLTDFHGVQELGFIAGTSLLAAFVSMLTVFPAVLVLMGRRQASRGRSDIGSVVATRREDASLIDSLSRRPFPVLAGAAIVTALSLSSARTIAFDYNLLHLQARDTESVTWEEQIIRAQARSSFAALSTATSFDELRRKRDAFARLPSVADVDSALLVIPEEQSAKLKIIGDFAPLIAGLRIGSPPGVHLSHLDVALAALKRRVDIASAEAGGARPAGSLTAISRQLADLLEALRSMDRPRAEVALTRYEAAVAGDFIDKLRLLRSNAGDRGITPDDVPAELRRKFISEGGRFLLQIHPKVNVWDRDGALRFVDELRSIDPDVTGSPVIAYESIVRMERAYRQGMLYAFGLVSLISAIMIRRLRYTVLALTPLVLGSLWLMGLMHLFDLQLNLANVWGAPLIIGASAEYGVNVVIRLMEARERGGPFFPRSTIVAVALNGLTTIAGFGSLLVAHHRGIQSLGLLLTLGSAASLIASLVVLPALTRLVEPGPEKEDTAPGRNP
jgi:hopanoid biosynthesis associated RND transporter like protein HpnN